MRRHAALSLLMLALPVLGSGCRHGPRAISAPDDALWLRPDQVGDPQRARLAGLQDRVGRQSETDDLPRGVLGAALQDEATLVRFDAQQVCVDLLIRSAAHLDRALRQWEYYVNGERLDGPALMGMGDETLTVRDHPFEGREPVLVAHGPTGSLSFSVPTERVFRVMEREARLCFPRTWVPGNVLSLEVQGDSDFGPGAQRHTFSWAVAP